MGDPQHATLEWGVHTTDVEPTMPDSIRHFFVPLLLSTACGDPSERLDAPDQVRACGPEAPTEVEANAACGADEAAMVRDAQTLADELWNMTVAENEARLHALVGRFACGAAPVYRGDADVRSISGEAPVLDGPVVAAVIDVDEGSYGFRSDEHVPHLVVSADDDVHMYLRHPQSQPGTTHASFPNDRLDGNGVVAECSNCLPNLTQPHETFDIDLRAELSFFERTLEASIDLERIEPEDVTWSDIERFSGFGVAAWPEYVKEFEACGPVLVRDFEDRLVEYAPSFGDHREGTCYYNASYTARWWVDSTNLARHGVGDLVISSASHCCGGVEGVGEDCRAVDF